MDTSLLRFKKDMTIYDILYYGNKWSADDSIKHLGDNQTGIGDGDDEVI